MMQSAKLTLLFLLILCISAGRLTAQKRTDSQTVASAKPADPVDAKVEGMSHYAGYIDFYYDKKQDKVFLVIDKLDKEFLYVESLTAAIGSNDIGLDRNQLGSQRIVKFERRSNKIFLTEPGTFYRAVSNNAAERNAVEQSFAQSVLCGFPIIEESSATNRFLVDASDFFLQDAHNVAGTLRAGNEGSYSLDRSRSSFYPERIRNFPKNSEFEVILTFSGQATGDYLSGVVPTSSSVTVREHYSFVELPDDNFVPRKFDPRAGYFSLSYYDYAKPFTEPIEQRLITRHRLAKKDPGASISEAVKPIIYYVDPGAPEPVRKALMEGASWWNQAFEAAGYRNAFKVEVLPNDADPMDVRYNVINWVHRATRGWSYGAEIVDPRTGEIIKGHVSLGSLRDRQDFLIAEGLLAPYEDGKPLSNEMETLTYNRLRQLSAHEVGHTLGLAHSYTSSSEGRASVMDYPQPQIKLVNGKIDLTDAYDEKIGEWDKVAIAYGYQDFTAGTTVEKACDDIIQNSIRAGLTFLSDQDARPAGSAHPSAHLWDNGKNAADELNRMMEIRKVVLSNFGEKNIPAGFPMAMIEEALVPMYFYHRYQAEAASKMIGGLNYRYALKGDGQLITAFISPVDQQMALTALLATVAPAALMLSEKLLKIIPPRPLGYERHREVIKIRTAPAFDALAIAESAADITFTLLLNPARANRLIEYHARDLQQPGLGNILDKTISATFKVPAKSGYEGAVQRVVEQVLMINLFKLAANQTASAQTRALAFFKLEKLTVWLRQQRTSTTDEDWQAHYDYLLLEISKFQKDPNQYKTDTLLSAPPGSPIGLDSDFCGN